MPTTNTFVVNSKTKKIIPIQSNPREYWIEGGEFENTADTIISVFGINNEESARTLYNALAAAGLGDKYFHVSVEVK